MTLAQMERVEKTGEARHDRFGCAVRTDGCRNGGAVDHPGVWPACCLPPTGWLDGGMPTSGTETVLEVLQVRQAVVVGVDAHRRTHTLVAVDGLGRKLAEKTVGTSSQSHEEAVRWARTRFRTVELVWGVEDCRSLTARLERDLLATGQKVVRVPTHLMSRARTTSREPGKSDPIDALAVARAVLREPDLPIALLDQHSMELRLLVDRREDLIRQRVVTINRLLNRAHQLDPEWSKSRNWDARKPREVFGTWLDGQTGLLAELAREEFQELIRLTEAAQDVAKRIGGRVRLAAPALLELPGCGELTAAKIVAEVAGIERFKSEAAFARYIGVAPVPHWSGSTAGTVRHVRHGNRQLNAAVHRIALVQISKIGPGRSYFQRRRAEGDTPQQALRALKRRIARVVYNRLKACQPGADSHARGNGRIPAIFALPLVDLQIGRQRSEMAGTETRK